MIVLRDSKKNIISPEDLFECVKSLLQTEDAIDQEKEHFYVLHLDTRSRVNLVELVSFGILNTTCVHPREVFRRAVAEGTYSIIIAHNHPSGDVTPSDEDIKLTERLKVAGEIMGIQLVDHIVFSPTQYYSLREKGNI